MRIDYRAPATEASDRFVLLREAGLLPLPFVAGPAYAIPFWSAYTLWIVLETVTSLRKRSRDKSSWRDRGSYGLIIGLLWAGFFRCPVRYNFSC